MSADEGKKPARKGPRLPKMPKVPKVPKTPGGPKGPKGPKAPSGNPFANRFAATVATSTPPPASATASSSQLVSVSVETDAVDLSRLTPVPTPVSQVIAPQAPSPQAAPVTPAPSSAAEVSLDDLDELHGDGADDFAALFAEVMDGEGEDTPPTVSAPARAPVQRARVDESPIEAEPTEAEPAVALDGDELTDDDAALLEEGLQGIPDDASDKPSDVPVTEEQTRNYMAVFANEIRLMSIDERIAAAQHADSERLHAFCYDSANARVIKAVLENGHAGFSHARLIMAHHHTSAGLLLTGSRASFLRDAGVQRALFKNPQAPQGLLQRIVQHKPLQQVYQLAISREQTGKVKSAMRVLFRRKFQRSSPEECAALIIKTEARCLIMLAGIPLSAKTCAILCGRPIHSTMMIQNLARFPATLPRLLEHMSRQPAVKRNASLRNMILRHPNAPSQLKRS